MLFTPFDKKGCVNGEAIDALIEHGLKGGLKGFYLTGSTGEGSLLANEERDTLESLKTTSRKLLLSMDRLDLSDGDIRHEYIPDFLFSAT